VDVGDEKSEIHVKKHGGVAICIHFDVEMVPDIIMFKWLSEKTIFDTSAVGTHFDHG
jgi:hypothetical protein